MPGHLGAPMTSDKDTHHVMSPARRAQVDRAIRKHNRLLVQWLTKKFGDPETARDIAQSAYLRVWRYAEKNEIDNPRALIFKTAANLAANEFRARRRSSFIENIGSETDPDAQAQTIDQLPSQAPSPEQQAVTRQDLAASIDIINGFPTRVRNAFILSRFENKNYREIAKELNVSESSVEKYIITALKALRQTSEKHTPTKNVLKFSKHRIQSKK